MTIRNPIEWSVDQLRSTAHGVEAFGRAMRHTNEIVHSPPLPVRRIGMADLRAALAEGWADFGACRTDVVFLCIAYPLIGLVLARAVFGYGMLQFLFPLASGFALIGPFAAMGLYEMSRAREQGREPRWSTAFEVMEAPSFGQIILFGALLVLIFAAWIYAARTIYFYSFGELPPVSLSAFVHEVFTTAHGWALIGFGVGMGFIFAVLVLLIGSVSVPLLLDRDVGLDAAIGASLRAFTTNPGTMALWGLIVAGGLVLGSIPLFLGLIVTVPVLGHATWHLYRRLIAI